MTCEGVSEPARRTSVRHFGITVPDLHAAESFYSEQFGMEVMFRETLLDDHQWHTLPEGLGWEDAVEKGVAIGMVALSCPGFVLALFQQDALKDGLTVVGLVASPSHLADLRRRVAAEREADVSQTSRVVEFVDPVGITWQITDDERFLSNGETSDRWLKA